MGNCQIFNTHIYIYTHAYTHIRKTVIIELQNFNYHINHTSNYYYLTNYLFFNYRTVFLSLTNLIIISIYLLLSQSRHLSRITILIYCLKMIKLLLSINLRGDTRAFALRNIKRNYKKIPFTILCHRDT